MSWITSVLSRFDRAEVNPDKVANSRDSGRQVKPSDVTDSSTR